MLERYIGNKNAKANLSKRNLSYSMVNAIKNKYLKGLKSPNKGKKYNSNIFKDRNNKIKKLALLGRNPNK